MLEVNHTFLKSTGSHFLFFLSFSTQFSLDSSFTQVANLACSISNNEEGVKLVRMAATQIDSLCPQVSALHFASKFPWYPKSHDALPPYRTPLSLPALPPPFSVCVCVCVPHLLHCGMQVCVCAHAYGVQRSTSIITCIIIMYFYQVSLSRSEAHGFG